MFAHSDGKDASRPRSGKLTSQVSTSGSMTTSFEVAPDAATVAQAAGRRHVEPVHEAPRNASGRAAPASHKKGSTAPPFDLDDPSNRLNTTAPSTLERRRARGRVHIEAAPSTSSQTRQSHSKRLGAREVEPVFTPPVAAKVDKIASGPTSLVLSSSDVTQKKQGKLIDQSRSRSQEPVSHDLPPRFGKGGVVHTHKKSSLDLFSRDNTATTGVAPRFGKSRPVSACQQQHPSPFDTADRGGAYPEPPGCGYSAPRTRLCRQRVAVSPSRLPPSDQPAPRHGKHIDPERHFKKVDYVFGNPPPPAYPTKGRAAATAFLESSTTSEPTNQHRGKAILRPSGSNVQSGAMSTRPW
eukprot:PhM_4_TR2572/c0_g2_i1/m.86504